MNRIIFITISTILLAFIIQAKIAKNITESNQIPRNINISVEFTINNETVKTLSEKELAILMDEHQKYLQKLTTLEYLLTIEDTIKDTTKTEPNKNIQRLHMQVSSLVQAKQLVELNPAIAAKLFHYQFDQFIAIRHN